MISVSWAVKSWSPAWYFRLATTWPPTLVKTGEEGGEADRVVVGHVHQQGRGLRFQAAVRVGRRTRTLVGSMKQTRKLYFLPWVTSGLVQECRPWILAFSATSRPPWRARTHRCR